MKHTITILLACLIISASAQYEPMVVEGNLWTNQLQTVVDIDTQQWFEGDTLLGEQTYKKLWTQVENQQMAIIEGLWREDLAEQRIYAWVDTSEVLVYDFDVSVGDMLTIYVYNCFSDVEVSGVGTIMVEGEEREMISFENEIWIEGIGSQWTPQGAGYYNCIDNLTPVLKCFFEQGELRYFHEDFAAECNTVSIENTIPDLQVSPNPVTDMINVSGSFEAGAHYVLIDVFGRSVRRGLISQSTQFQLELSNLASGFYFLIIRDELAHGSVRIQKL